LGTIPYVRLRQENLQRKDWKLPAVARRKTGYGCPGGVDRHQDGSAFDPAIVSGGFSGICAAWHLLHNEGLRPPFRCAIIGPDAQLGTGPFSTIQQTYSQLVAQLLENGLVQPDAFRLGQGVNRSGQLLDAEH
jgi:uncharacterized NAD(P)/FAD-binding protein YdhS